MGPEGPTPHIGQATSTSLPTKTCSVRAYSSSPSRMPGGVLAAAAARAVGADSISLAAPASLSGSLSLFLSLFLAPACLTDLPSRQPRSAPRAPGASKSSAGILSGVSKYSTLPSDILRSRSSTRGALRASMPRRTIPMPAGFDACLMITSDSR